MSCWGVEVKPEKSLEGGILKSTQVQVSVGDTVAKTVLEGIDSEYETDSEFENDAEFEAYYNSIQSVPICQPPPPAVSHDAKSAAKRKVVDVVDQNEVPGRWFPPWNEGRSKRNKRRKSKKGRGD